MGKSRTATYYSVVEEYFSITGQPSEYRESAHVSTFEEAYEMLKDFAQSIIQEITHSEIVENGVIRTLNCEGEEILADYDGEHDCIIRLWEGSRDVEGDRNYCTVANLDILCWKEV